MTPTRSAPPQGRRDGSSRDEPFAWEAREFLRTLAIGKVGHPLDRASDHGLAGSSTESRMYSSTMLAGKPKPVQ